MIYHKANNPCLKLKIGNSPLTPLSLSTQEGVRGRVKLVMIFAPRKVLALYWCKMRARMGDYYEHPNSYS